MARSSARTIPPSCAGSCDEDVRLCITPAAAGTGPRTPIPADAISLRAVTSDNFVVVDITGEHKVIAEVSFPAALTTLHEKAIYLHEARQYQVERFDYDGRKAYVRSVDSRLLHRRHRLHAGEGAGGVRIART